MAFFDINPNLVYSVLAILPPGAVFYLAYGRYDGTFRDNVVFLYFMGGILMGFLLGFLTVLATLAIPSLFLVLLLALLFPIAVTVGINRRKWQGERHAVFNGGAFGIGLALMLGFTLLYRQFADAPITGTRLGLSILLSLGLTGTFFGLGLFAGDAVRRRKPIRSALSGAAMMVVPSLLIIFFGLDTPRGVEFWTAWLWVALLVAYGAVFAFMADQRLMIQGVSDEARRQRRRWRRRSAE